MMEKFTNILDAIHYRKACPICKGKMEVSERDRDIATDLGYQYRGGEQRISFYLSPGEDVVTINPITQEVEITVTRRRGQQTVYTAGSNQTFTVPGRPAPAYNFSQGKFIHGLTIECRTCCQYTYTLQVHIDLTAKRLSEVYLNSETISVEDTNDWVHEIKNNYVTEKTRYCCFANPKGLDDIDYTLRHEKNAEIPLVPLDIDRPADTVSRVRKLIIFS